MESKKRLIDANAFREFLEVIQQDYREENTLTSGFAACLIEMVQDEYLALAPTVDAVEVVRCKDCKIAFANPFIADFPQLVCRKWANWHVVEPNDFCSYGERKDNVHGND